MTDPIEHSAEACPVCGAQRPALRIACLACGAGWPDLEAFRAAREGRPQPDRAGGHRRR